MQDVKQPIENSTSTSIISTRWIYFVSAFVINRRLAWNNITVVRVRHWSAFIFWTNVYDTFLIRSKHKHGKKMYFYLLLLLFVYNFNSSCWFVLPHRLIGGFDIFREIKTRFCLFCFLRFDSFTPTTKALRTDDTITQSPWPAYSSAAAPRRAVPVRHDFRSRVFVTIGID